ncbi:MAG: hypothetical protein JRF24_07265 [Deltaproteobacteria bacterium]|nr:hypothetical protein [Deltaproteobacteria bacterium]
MKIHLSFSESNSTNTRITVIIDGTTCGEMSMSTEEAIRFLEVVKVGCSQNQDQFESSGELYMPEDWVLWHKRSGIERRRGRERRAEQDRRTEQDRRSGNDQRTGKT